MKVFTVKCRRIVSLIVAIVMLALTMTYNISMESSAVNTSLTYKVYNSSGYYTGSYTLAANSVTDKSRSIVGTDDRTLDTTKSGVVKIVTDRKCSTGFIVDAHTIATAAHCVYEDDYDVANSYNGDGLCNIYVFDSNGDLNINITKSQITGIHIPELYISSGGDTNQYDYALITVSEAIDLSSYAYNLGVMLDGFKTSGKTVYNTGFPDTVRNKKVNDADTHEAYTGTGVVTDAVFDLNLQFGFDCDTSGGNSGGPVYTIVEYDDKKYYTVIGINAGYVVNGCNIATRVTTDLLHFYKNNPNI